MRTRAMLRAAVAGSVAIACGAVLGAQTPPTAPAPIEKLGKGVYRMGAIQIDTTQREISIPGRINEAMMLEFVANARDGHKAYESAISLDTDAVSFNAALLLIGLDRARARVPVQHFDPIPPQGDEVTLHVEWQRGAEKARVPVEELLFDRENGKVVPSSAWVYTGSTFSGGRYLAELDGTLIGFVHSPTPIIEQVGGAGVGRFGHIILNPGLGLTPDTRVTLRIKAVAAPDPARRTR